MPYQLFDNLGNEVHLHDLQDKGPWCSTGSTFEQVFIARYGEQLNLIINPAKVTDVYAPDLYNSVSRNIGDLKTQNTPFFQAQDRYNLNPQYAVTFNVKDFNRYSRYYPTIEIYFWVKWLATQFLSNGVRTTVQPLEGVWYIPFSNITDLTRTSPIHRYQQRYNDTRGNARDSYLFDLQGPLFTRLI